ncbi:non-homologous end joining protein Ku (plasmid) [Rhizobium leguminosarum]|jgi:DNA end-binding protein Ku|uniref:Non-homologous end joining protein Ku n=2 Tax=Rhizobium leguminosarum TaxID=384 RepID=A0A1B8R5K2_RHILT|nr:MULTISPECIES: Ku protein [Rhizobium]MDH6662615.1 DNA end-binding protein Ku [Rhizobium sophorae]AOO93179.1 DNA helicase [Rhizobium leguminosarum bv. trifolii]ASS58256.1 Ku protein [Rhizobium leguminosarum bv. viciae]AVC46485.1 ku protein [Rhizobium leguminosarum bv. viciae]MBB4332658.1 DNA end-binding protein Ku [Rhizobium leguminosarum]
MAGGHRAQWKGFLKFSEVSCGVALYTAASTSERITFHTINRLTGNRVNRVFIDSETEDPVPKEAQTKGFEIENGRYIIIDPEEVAAAIPESNKTLEIEAFIPCADVDDVYFDKPYYLTPDKMGGDAFAALRDGMKKSKVVAIARTVLFRRMRTVLIRPHGKGLIATTLNYDYEVRSSAKAFEEMPKMKIVGEMLDLAKHIISTKKGEFDPATFDDRYEAAVAELVKAKIEGKALPKRKEVKVSKPNDLLAALRESARMVKAAESKPKRTAANANAGSSRDKARRASGKSAAAPAAQRKAS